MTKKEIYDNIKSGKGWLVPFKELNTTIDNINELRAEGYIEYHPYPPRQRIPHNSILNYGSLNTLKSFDESEDSV